MNKTEKIQATISYPIHTSLGAVIIRKNGNVEIIDPNHNSRVNVGAALITYLISGSNLGSLTTPGVPINIALSANTLTPAATDTTLSGEISLNGLGRHVGTVGGYSAPASLDGAASYTITYTWTASGAQTVNSAALFDAISGGNLFVEANLSSSATLGNGDNIQVTWTVNL